MSLWSRRKILPFLQICVRSPSSSIYHGTAAEPARPAGKRPTAARRGRVQPLLRLTLASQAAASSSTTTEQLKDGTTGSGSFGDGKHTVGLGSA